MNEHDATETAYRNGYADGKPKWISVKERLPRINVGVLVYTPRLKNIFEAFYKVDCKWEIFSYRGGDILNDEVTHWMPLPSTEGLE